MQLDADEDGEPFFKPPAVASVPLRPRDEQPEGEGQHRAQPSITSESKEEEESKQSTAAIAAAEQDE